MDVGCGLALKVAPPVVVVVVVVAACQPGEKREGEMAPLRGDEADVDLGETAVVVVVLIALTVPKSAHGRPSGIPGRVEAVVG